MRGYKMKLELKYAIGTKIYTYVRTKHKVTWKKITEELNSPTRRVIIDTLHERVVYKPLVVPSIIKSITFTGTDFIYECEYSAVPSSRAFGSLSDMLSAVDKLNNTKYSGRKLNRAVGDIRYAISGDPINNVPYSINISPLVVTSINENGDLNYGVRFYDNEYIFDSISAAQEKCNTLNKEHFFS